jgi:pimeloyl-ACP methyl ester carboxylesterase
MRSSALESKQESGVLPIDPPTPYTHYFGGAPPAGRILAIHGLDVSKELMSLISAALADSGFEVYAIDLPGHGDSKAEFQTELAKQTLRSARGFLGENTIVLGHSLGAGLLLDLAASERFSTMVLLSPPPLPVGDIHADRVLIATGQLDIPRIRAFATIAADIGDPKVEAWILPWGGHSAPVLNPIHIQRIVNWLGGAGGPARTVWRMLWIAIMLAAASVLGVALSPGHELKPIDLTAANALGRYIAAAITALLVLKFVSPAAFLRFFATDYLIGFLLVTGLCVWAWAAAGNTATPAWRKAATVTAVISAAFVIAIPGMIVGSRLLHMSLSDGRWWRFPFIVIAGLPLFLADELTIRRIHPRWKSEGVALLTRLLFLAFLLTGALTLNRDRAFLVLIAAPIVVFWITLWFAAGVIHRRTQSPWAAALFAALVQGWAFAAWFVTI